MSTKTVHLPPTEMVAGFELKFPSTNIHGYEGAGVGSKTAKFRCALPLDKIEGVFKHMGWPLPGEKSSMERLDGTLKGGHFILTPKLDNDDRLKLKSKNGDVDVDAEIDIEYAKISGFECHRLEIEGRKKKGFRRELRFTVTFPETCRDAMANVEAYVERTGNAKGTLKVIYFPEAIQEALPGTQDDDSAQGSLEIGDVQASEEQRAAAAEIPVETGTLASTRQMGAKRGRLVDTKAN